MITLKLPYTSSDSASQDIKNLRKQYSSVVRYAYNRFHEGLKQLEVRQLCRNLNNINLLNSWLLQCAVLEGQNIQTKNKEKVVVFGGKKNFDLRTEGKLSKEEFQMKRLLPLNIQGEALHKGNRLFDFNELTQNKLKFKINKKLHLELSFPSQRKNYRKKLELLEQMSSTKDITIGVRLTEKSLYLCYEEPKQEPASAKVLKDNRYMGIDLNPEFIGVTIFNDDKIIHTQAFDFSKITSKLEKEHNASDSKRFKYLNNKLKHETLESSKVISGLARDFQCKFVFTENLKKIDSGDAKKGHGFNRLTRNLWKRTYFDVNLSKRLNLLNIKTFKVNPMYTSIIGNLQHDFFDPCNAAAEVGRRGYEVIIKKNKKFYPNFSLKDSKSDLWKKHGLDECKDWKQAFVLIKKSKLRYRVPLVDANISQSLKMKSKRSQVTIYTFGQEIDKVYECL